MSAVDPSLTARQVARRRRARAAADVWRSFRRQPAGMAGLVVLLVFVVLALAAPLLFPPETIEVTRATGGVLEPPSRDSTRPRFGGMPVSRGSGWPDAR